jgi:hypothetical protein
MVNLPNLFKYLPSLFNTFNCNKIKCEKEVKLLGVTIDFLLKFNSHISNICKKASRQLNVLKRLGKYLNKLDKLTIYHSFILSNFNFCPLSWHFCSEANAKYNNENLFVS